MTDIINKLGSIVKQFLKYCGMFVFCCSFRTKSLLHSQHSPVTFVYTIALGLKTQDRPWEPDFHWGPFAICPRHTGSEG